MQNAMSHKHLRIRTAGSLQFIKCHPNGACIVWVSMGPLISLQVFFVVVVVFSEQNQLLYGHPSKEDYSKIKPFQGRKLWQIVLLPSEKESTLFERANSGNLSP